MCDLTSASYLTIREVSEQLHLSRSKVYDLIGREGLPVVRFGRAVRVSVAALEQWLERRQPAETAWPSGMEPHTRLGLRQRTSPRRFPARSPLSSGPLRDGHGIVRPDRRASQKGTSR